VIIEFIEAHESRLMFVICGPPVLEPTAIIAFFAEEVVWWLGVLIDYCRSITD